MGDYEERLRLNRPRLVLGIKLNHWRVYPLPSITDG